MVVSLLLGGGIMKVPRPVAAGRAQWCDQLAAGGFNGSQLAAGRGA